MLFSKRADAFAERRNVLHRKAVRHRDHIPGIALAEYLLLAHVKADSGGERHQHHRAENAYRSKPGAVLPHAVGHLRHGDEVVGLVVVPLILLEHPAQHHRASDEQQVGRGDNEENSRHECEDGAERLLYRDRHEVRQPEHERSEDGCEPVSLRGLFAGVLRAEKLYGL